MHVPLNMSTFFNNRGVTSANNMEVGFLTLGLSSLPKEHMDYEREHRFQFVPFKLQYLRDFDNMELEGQTVHFKRCCIEQIHVLGGSNNGDLSDEVQLLDGDSIIGSCRLFLSDFYSVRPFFDDVEAIRLPYMHTRSGVNHNYKPAIWYNNLIKNGRVATCNGMHFPDNPSIHIFAITLEIKYSLDGEE